MLSPFLISLTLITSVVAQDNQPPKKAETLQPPAATVVVSGRAVYDDTGQPATRHRVQLIASEALLNARNGLRIPTAMTNERGEFSVQYVSAGEYYVYAEAVDQRGSRRLTQVLNRSNDSAADAANLEQFKKDNPRITVDGQHNAEVNLRLPNPHFGTISGIVFDAAHQPAAQAMVHVTTKANDSLAVSVRTDDQGRYRVRGLPKGEYIVRANPPAKPRADGEKNKDFQGAPGATYFPSTLLLRNSPAVAVLPDLDTANIDVTLVARALRNITGTIKMRGDNRPVTNASLQLSVKQITDPSSDTSRAAVNAPMSLYLSSTDASGRWSFSNVPDGSYRLFVQPRQLEASGPKFVVLEQELTVEGADVEDLLIEVSEGARLSGVITLEGNNAAPLQNITVSANTYTPPANTTITIDEVGKFTLTAVPMGEVQVSAFPSPEDKFYVKSIAVNGLDLMRDKLTVTESDEIKDVRIVISTGVGVITGRVLSQTGDKPVAGVDVMLRRTVDDHRLFGGKLTALTDERGVFTLSAAPGTYHVIAWRTTDGNGAFGEAMNRATREQGTGLTLSPNDRKEITLRLP